MYEMMGDPEVDKDLLREASPLFHVDNIKKPLFVAQGAKRSKSTSKPSRSDSGDFKK